MASTEKSIFFNVFFIHFFKHFFFLLGILSTSIQWIKKDKEAVCIVLDESFVYKDVCRKK